ncbi:MAG: hypothetical protein ACREIF_00250 [Chthoniobacterales bacterium]
MPEVDKFSRSLLEEAKRFLEKAHEEEAEGQTAFLHAALLLAFSALEAHLNAVASDFLTRKDLSILDRSILSEQDFKLEGGDFVLKEGLKMYRLEDRFEFIYAKFSSSKLDKSASWWAKLKGALHHRNQLVHPKEATKTTPEIVEGALTGIIDAIDALYAAVYQRPFPAKTRGLQSTLKF